VSTFSFPDEGVWVPSVLEWGRALPCILSPRKEVPWMVGMTELEGSPLCLLLYSPSIPFPVCQPIRGVYHHKHSCVENGWATEGANVAAWDRLEGWIHWASFSDVSVSDDVRILSLRRYRTCLLFTVFDIWDLVKTVSFRGTIMAGSCTVGLAKFLYCDVFHHYLYALQHYKREVLGREREREREKVGGSERH
jgi:hypothetical protein